MPIDISGKGAQAKTVSFRWGRLRATSFIASVLLLVACGHQAKASGYSNLSGQDDHASRNQLGDVPSELLPSRSPLRLAGASQWTQPALGGHDANSQVSVLESSIPNPSTLGNSDASSFSVQPPRSLRQPQASDRFWLISTRHLSNDTCRVNLRVPNFSISRLDRCGRATRSSLGEYLDTVDPTRPRLIYVHGNRRSAKVAVSQGLFVYREIARSRPNRQPIDWVIWSWPSDSETFVIIDARRKAERTDAQGLYLAWLLNQHVQALQPTGLIGFSFGARIVTGGLHALAGGSLGRRKLASDPVQGQPIDVGLLAPAMPSHWLCAHGAHRLATKNMDRMVLLYNHRDIILKNYWLVDRVRGSKALGYTGPQRFAPRFDGTKLPVRARDCAKTVGTDHSEKEYYRKSCYAGREMATLIESTLVAN